VRTSNVTHDVQLRPHTLDAYLALRTRAGHFTRRDTKHAVRRLQRRLEHRIRRQNPSNQRWSFK